MCLTVFLSTLSPTVFMCLSQLVVVFRGLDEDLERSVFAFAFDVFGVFRVLRVVELVFLSIIIARRFMSIGLF